MRSSTDLLSVLLRFANIASQYRTIPWFTISWARGRAKLNGLILLDNCVSLRCGTRFVIIVLYLVAAGCIWSQQAHSEINHLMRDAMIHLTNLEKSVPQGAQRYYILRRISLEIKEGEFVSIMGPSGAGKSTLLHIIGMHDNDWQGEYVFAEQAVHQLKPKQRAELRNRNIGFVFQSYHLLDHLTVAENLEMPLSYRDVKKSERDAIVGDVLDRFQIVGKKDLYPTQLSGGQQQLVGVARAVIANPKIILADEPTGNLHSGQAKEIMELFKKLNDAGTTIVQVTHSEVNASYGNRVIELRDGWMANA